MAAAVLPTLLCRAVPGNAEKGGMSDSLGFRALIDGTERLGYEVWCPAGGDNVNS